MAIGRPTKPLNVTPEEKEKLSMLARRPKSAQAIAMRARIVLGCSDGLSNGGVAKRLRITGATVCKWRERFRVNRLEGLLDEPRPGAPRSITDARVEEVITKTLESMPVNSTHWSTRLMAQKTGLRRRRSCGFGELSDCSRIVWRTSNSPKTRSLLKRCGTSSGCT